MCRASKLTTSQIMSKVSSCFICGQQFDFNLLNDHEKTCLENIKSNDVQYTRQNTNDEQVSSVSSKAESLSLSNTSNQSTSSGEVHDKTKVWKRFSSFVYFILFYFIDKFYNKSIFHTCKREVNTRGNKKNSNA